MSLSEPLRSLARPTPQYDVMLSGEPLRGWFPHEPLARPRRQMNSPPITTSQEGTQAPGQRSSLMISRWPHLLSSMGGPYYLREDALLSRAACNEVSPAAPLSRETVKKEELNLENRHRFRNQSSFIFFSDRDRCFLIILRCFFSTTP
jgi:hypothetical protein